MSLFSGGSHPPNYLALTIERSGLSYNALKAENASHRTPFVHAYDNTGISSKKAKAIVEDYFSTDMSLKELAAKHGVSTTTVTKYVNKAKKN